MLKQKLLRFLCVIKAKEGHNSSTYISPRSCTIQDVELDTAKINEQKVIYVIN